MEFVSMVPVIGILAITSLFHTDYAQVSCEIDNESDYAIIWVDEASKVVQHRPLQFSVQFDPKGLVVRLPPQYYAPDWTQVESIEMKYHDRNSKSGLLQLYLYDTDGSVYIERVEHVERPCWNSVKKYILEHVVSKGTVVRFSETRAN